MSTQMGNRTEFCQHRQDEFEEFARRYYERNHLTPPSRLPLYPEERMRPTIAEITGWRLSMYVGNGKSGRVFPFRLNLAGRTPDLGVHEFRRSWTVTCDHECRPRPHPVCACGVWACERADQCATLLDSVDSRGWRGVLADPEKRVIAYPVLLRTARRWPTLPAEVKWELVGLSAEIAGPILTISPAIASDPALAERGLECLQVGDTKADLQRYLKAVAR